MSEALPEGGFGAASEGDLGEAREVHPGVRKVPPHEAAGDVEVGGPAPSFDVEAGDAAHRVGAEREVMADEPACGRREVDSPAESRRVPGPLDEPVERRKGIPVDVLA